MIKQKMTPMRKAGTRNCHKFKIRRGQTHMVGITDTFQWNSEINSKVQNLLATASV